MATGVELVEAEIVDEDHNDVRPVSIRRSRRCGSLRTAACRQAQEDEQTIGFSHELVSLEPKESVSRQYSGGKRR